jgi:hypothetical protein
MARRKRCGRGRAICVPGRQTWRQLERVRKSAAPGTFSIEESGDGTASALVPWNPITAGAPGRTRQPVSASTQPVSGPRKHARSCDGFFRQDTTQA